MTVYNGTITVGSGDGAYGFIRSGNVFGDPSMGSVSVDAGSPQVDEFYWTADGSVLYIMLVGNHSGVVNFNGNEYPFVYSEAYDISEYNGVGLGGPYPTSGTVNFTYDSAPASATYTLALETNDISLDPQAVGLVSSYITALATFDATVSFPAVSLVDGTTASISLETCDISVAGSEVGLNAGYSLFIQSKLIAPIFEDVGLLSSTNELPLETFDVQILVYADGMGLLRGGGITLESSNVSVSFPEVFLTTGSAPARPSRSFGVVFA